MNDGIRRGLLIVVAALLSIALLLAIAVAWYGGGIAQAHDLGEASAKSFAPDRVLTAASAASRRRAASG
jgi:hypothetical protein